MENLWDFIVTYQWLMFPLLAISSAAPVLIVRKESIRTATISLGALVFASFGLGSIGPIPGGLGIDFVPPLHCEREGSRHLLIFLHGWLGDDTTWKKFPDMVCNDQRFNNADVLLLNYPTFIVKQNLRISELSDSFNNDLEEWGVSSRYAKVAFITHSMGGLVARKLIVFRDLKRQLNGRLGLIISIASPFQGADPLKLVKALGLEPSFLGRLSQKIGFSPGLADELLPKSTLIGDLTIEWKALSQRPTNHCLYSQQDKVVSDESAKHLCDSVDTYREGGHKEIVKPSGPKDRKYDLPMRKVASYFGNLD